MADDQRRETNFDAWWERIAQGGKDVDASEFDDDTAGAALRVRALFQAQVTPAAARRLRSRVLAELMVGAAKREPRTRLHRSLDRMAPTLGRPLSNERGRVASLPGRILRFASAALLAVVLIGLVLRVLAPSSDHHATIPVGGSPVPLPASPSPSAGVSTFFAADYPAGSLPQGSANVVFARFQYEPGSIESVYGFTEIQHDIGTMLVVGGRFWIRADGPLTVLRAPDGRPEHVPPGTQAILEIGDAVYAPAWGVNYSRGAYGDEPATIYVLLVEGLFQGTPVNGTPTVGEASVETAFEVPLTAADRAGSKLDAGPVRAIVRQIAVPAGAAPVRRADRAYTVRVVVSGKATWGVVAGGRQTTPSATHSAFTGSAIPYTALQPGEAVMIANSIKVPLVYYEVTLEPAGTEGTPAGI
jgi:hypothetical protein